MLRYVERNPLRAKLVKRAEDYPWGSLSRRVQGASAAPPPLAESPVPLGRLWTEHVNQPQHEAEAQAIAESIRRGRPYGGESWQSKVANQLGLEYTFRDRGRPRIVVEE